MTFRKLMKHRIAQGLCCRCGDEPIAEGSKGTGAACLKKRREAQRKARGFNPKKEGGVGRPALT